MILRQELEKEGNWLFRYRSYLPIAMLALGLAWFAIQILHGHLADNVTFQHWHQWQMVCLTVSLFGFLVRVYTVSHTPEGTSGRNTKSQEAQSLNTTGIYSLVRHPLYLGNFLMYLGISMLTCSTAFVSVFVLVYWIYYERIMYCEEQFLQRKFGEAFLSWASQTPAFIPRLHGFVHPVYSFSWKKVLKKEKNGLFALLFVFSMFDVLRASIIPTFRINGNLLLAMLASACIYVVLKVIKKHTSWLDEAHR